MIADLDETIRQLLIRDIPINHGEIDVKFDQPKREWSARLSKPTINLYLYDMRENHLLRKNQMERIRHTGRKVTEQRSPVRLECTYMMTAWAAEPEDEHRLMGRALQALFRHPYLHPETLHGKLKRQRYKIPAQLARHDKLTNPAELWSALDNELRPSISFILTLALNPFEEVTGPAVRNLTMRTRLHTNGSNGLNGTAQSDGDIAITESMLIAGVVTVNRNTGPDGTAEPTPVSGVQVGIKDNPKVDITDERGRFKLRGLYSGTYTLIVWPPDGEPEERTITVPSEDGLYNIELAA